MEGTLEKNLRIGELLIKAGLIDSYQMRSALSYKRHWGGRMGESLVRLGYITDEDLTTFISKQFDLPQFDLITHRIPDDVLDYIPESKAYEFCVIPVDRVEIRGTMHLIVAMPDPTNLQVIDTLQFMTECWIKPTMISAELIFKAINLQYGAAANRRAKERHLFAPPPFPHQSVFEPIAEEQRLHGLSVKRLEENFEKLLRILIKHSTPSQVKDLIDLL
jgi:type IV pilus assembly protein PilB